MLCVLCCVHACVAFSLYSCSVPLLVYSLLGTSRIQAMGPTALDSILTFSMISSILPVDDTKNEATVRVRWQVLQIC